METYWFLSISTSLWDKRRNASLKANRDKEQIDVTKIMVEMFTKSPNIHSTQWQSLCGSMSAFGSFNLFSIHIFWFFLLVRVNRGEGEGDVKIKPTQNADNLAPDDNYSVLISYPLFLKWSIILVTESIGTAKPKPSAANTFMILTPITSPSTFTRGPPEFPYIEERLKVMLYVKTK